MSTPRRVVFLTWLAVALLGPVGAGARTTATPIAGVPALVETTLKVTPRDNAFPLLTSSLTIRIPAQWDEAEALLATPSGSDLWAGALGAILVRLELVLADDAEGAVRDLFPAAPEIAVADGVLTLSSHRTAELRGEGGANLGLWGVRLGPCAVVERTSPDPVSGPEDAGVAGDDAGSFDVTQGLEDAPGPTVRVRVDQPCDLYVSLDIPGDMSGVGGEEPESGQDAAALQLIADVWFEESRLIAATPMPVLLSSGHVRWTFADGPGTWMADAQVRPPTSTRLRFKAVAGLSNLQPVGIYLGPAAVLASAFFVGRRLRVSAPGDQELERDGRLLQRLTMASLLYLAAGTISWYALLWLQDPADARGEDWKASLYFGVAALPYLAAGSLAATASWHAIGRPWQRRALVVIAALVVGGLALMVPLAVEPATADPDVSTLVRELEILEWLPFLIPLLTTALVAWAVLWPIVGMNSPSAVEGRADEPRTGRRNVSLRPASQSDRIGPDRTEYRPRKRLGWIVALAVLAIVGSWLLFEWQEATGPGDSESGASWVARLQGILTFNGFFYAFEFVSEAAAFMPLIALTLVWAAIRRVGNDACAERPGVGQEWVSMGLAVLFAAFVVGYGVAILGIQIPVAYLAALVVWWTGWRALARWTADAFSQGGSSAVLPGERPPSSATAEGTAERQPSWWENGVFAARWGAVLGIPMVALFMYVLISDEETRWFEQSPSFRLMKFAIVLANETAVWVVAALVLGCLYTTLPGGRFGWVKGLLLALVFTLAEGAGLLARMLTGEDPGIDWLFRPLQVALFLMALGVVLDARYTGWVGVWAIATRPAARDQGWIRRVPGIVTYLGPLAVTMITVIQQILAGNATAALTEIISALPDLVSPLGRSA